MRLLCHIFIILEEIKTGKVSQSSLSPFFNFNSGKGGDISPFLLIYVESSPVNLTENARLLFIDLFSGAP